MLERYFEYHSGMDRESQPTRVLFFGEASAAHVEKSVAEDLKKKGLSIHDMGPAPSLDTEGTLEQRRAKLRERFVMIQEPQTRCVVFQDFSPQTLMEIAVAVAAQKPFYFLGCVPQAGECGFEEVDCLRPRIIGDSKEELIGCIDHPDLSYHVDLADIVMPEPASVALFCSMKFRDKAQEMQCELRERGIASYIPAEENHDIAALSAQKFADFKSKVMQAYFAKIRHPHTTSTLALNYPKHGKSDYIGPNTLMEMAVATAARKKNNVLFTLPSVDSPVYDAVSLLDPTALKGDVENFKV